MNASPGKIRVAIVVDSSNPERRRYCFLSDVLRQLPGVELDEVSFPEKRREVRYVDIDAYDVIMFNWDVTDGDYTFESDLTQAIIARRFQHFRNFVRSGGLVVAECQSSHWKPDQACYDLLFGKGELQVARFADARTGVQALVNPKLQNHPFLLALTETLTSQYSRSETLRWFPEGSVSPRAVELVMPSKLYSGWFERWNTHWLPLILEPENGCPIMLVKVEGGGAYVATTMFLGSSESIRLIRNMVEQHSKANTTKIILFHQGAVRQQSYEKLLARLRDLVIVLSPFPLTYIILRYLADLKSVALELLLSILIAVALYGVRKLWDTLKPFKHD